MTWSSEWYFWTSDILTGTSSDTELRGCMPLQRILASFLGHLIRVHTSVIVVKWFKIFNTTSHIFGAWQFSQLYIGEICSVAQHPFQMVIGY